MFYCFSTFVSVSRAVVTCIAIAWLVLSTVLYYCFLYCFLANKHDNDDDDDDEIFE